MDLLNEPEENILKNYQAAYMKEYLQKVLKII